MKKDDNERVREKIKKNGLPAGKAVSVLQFYFPDADHSVFGFDAVIHSAGGISGGRRFEETDDRDLCIDTGGLCGVYGVRDSIVFPEKVRADRYFNGAWQFEKTACAYALQGDRDTRYDFFRLRYFNGVSVCGADLERLSAVGRGQQ